MISIIGMSRRPSDGMVNNVEFKVSKTDGQLTAEYSGAVMLPPSQDPSQFIPFENLTQETVRAWVQEKLGDELKTIDELLDKKINDQKNPSVVVGLPW